MFSYRHAFHAGNHADVLKHTVLVAMVKHLIEKDAALTVIDTHAGAGLYRLDGDFADTSGEAAQGYLRLVAAAPAGHSILPHAAPGAIVSSEGKAAAGHIKPAPSATKKTAPPDPSELLSETPAALQDYLDLVATFNAKDKHRVYPGSPFIIQRLLRPHDRLKLFEIHPTDIKTLAANIDQLHAGRQVAVHREDGFEGLKKFLPPPARRSLVLCDPSYEIKSDYPRVTAMVTDAIKRFATGTYAVWYPLIPRPEAHDVPRKLKTLAVKNGKSWLNVALTVKSSKLSTDAQGEIVRPGLPASGMFIINPPHTLKAALQTTLPFLAAHLAQDRHGSFVLESGG